MNNLAVRTRRSFPFSASVVWPLLCNSRMDGTSSLLFKLGVPQPLECRVPDGHGGVGSERECISDQGVVHQRILVWEPERCLSFQLERTDMNFQRFVTDVVDTFDLAPTNAGVVVTRTTTAGIRGRFQMVRKFVLFLSLKQVHRYVFRNWRRLAERRTPVHVPAETGPTSRA
jgi:hypothetical protein